MPLPLVLPADLTISSVGELRPHWLGWLDDPAAAHRPVHAWAAHQVDAAGLQLLSGQAEQLQARFGLASAMVGSKTCFALFDAVRGGERVELGLLVDPGRALDAEAMALLREAAQEALAA